MIPIRTVSSLALALATLAVAPAAAQTLQFSGTRENVNPITPPGGRCVPPYFNTVTIAPNAISSTGTSNISNFTSTQSHCITSPPPNEIREGLFEYRFDAGDTIFGTYTGRVDTTGTPGVFSPTENLIITGGTGRFVNAGGSIDSIGTLRFGPDSTGIFMGQLTGNVTAAETTASGDFATAYGAPSAATGNYSSAYGAFSYAPAERATAVGSFAEAVGPGSLALGDNTFASGPASMAAGQNAAATAPAATAVGHNTVASGAASFAGGVRANAGGLGAVAVGQLSTAAGAGSVGVGASSAAAAPGAIAIGELSVANQLNATAVGQATTAQGIASTAIGHNADATAAASFAGGVSAQATGARSTALGQLSNASAVAATALGAGTSATFAGSTAIGTGAATTAANQLALGGTGSSVRVGDIAASTSAQSGPVSVLTVDASGTIGRNTALFTDLSAMQAAQASLVGRVDTLFDLRDLDQRDMRQGIAAAVAMGHASMPSAPGRTSYVLNGATFRGEFAVGGSIMHRLGGAESLAIGIGFSFAGNRNNAVRAGIAGEF